MNFTALKAELAARGFDYLSDTRQGQFINWAHAELDDLDLWPYRVATTSGTAPITIADLESVESVTDATTLYELRHRDRESLLFAFGDLTTAGTPRWWYIDTSGRLAVYPANTADTLNVVYYKVTPDLSGGTDTPLAPTRFHNVIVNIAVRMAYRDADNHQAAEALQVQIDRDVNRMRLALGVVDQGPSDFIETTERW